MLEGSIGRTIRLGIKSLRLHLLRSFLTALGILFGVGAVIVMLSITEGMSEEAQQKYRELGSNTIVVESRKPPEMEGQQQGGSMFRAEVYGLKYKDVDAIAETLPAVKIVVPVRSIPKLARNGQYTMSLDVYGTVPGFSDITGLRLREGRFLTRRDLERKNNYAVLGATVAQKLYPFEDPLGKPIRLGTESFRVVGVLAPPESTASGKSGTSAAEAVLVPMSAARAYFGEMTVKQTGGSRQIEQVDLHRLQVEVAGTGEEITANVLATARALRTLMKERHKQQDYGIIVPLELLRQAEATARIWNIVLGVIAFISLLIGGIGIMNVMLATVTERTREIGIRRALGAKRRHIVSQFLVETVVLSCGGGFVGVILGVAAAIGTELVTGGEVPTIVLPRFAALAFGVSAGVGLLFGLYPAWRAAQMDPVEALRHE